MDIIVVKFENNFMAPGFGRTRFPKGIVHDVPAAMRDKLPKSAEVLDDYKTEEQTVADADSLAAHDFARMERTDEEALIASGLAGLADELVDEVEVVEAPKATKHKKSKK